MGIDFGWSRSARWGLLCVAGAILWIVVQKPRPLFSFRKEMPWSADSLRIPPWDSTSSPWPDFDLDGSPDSLIPFSVPVFWKVFDADQDGDLDVIARDSKGVVRAFENQATAHFPDRLWLAVGPVDILGHPMTGSEVRFYRRYRKGVPAIFLTSAEYPVAHMAIGSMKSRAFPAFDSVVVMGPQGQKWIHRAVYAKQRFKIIFPRGHKAQFHLQDIPWVPDSILPREVEGINSL